MSEAGPRVNGPASPSGRFIDTVDPDDPEYRRNLQRPAEVKEDMKQMEGRSRVSVVLNSQAFREELEEIIQDQIHQGGPASIFALQQISDLLLPPTKGGYSSFARNSPVIPINDIRGVETLGYTKQEKILRCKLAACYRLVDLQGWSHGIFNHISARVSQDTEQFLVNPFGMLYSEITASTLVKVDVRGEVVDSGSTGLGISKAAFTLHSAIHQARPDIKCVIHLHTPAVVAVSAFKRGLLPISQEAMICGKVSYHDYRGILVDQEERDALARNLGPFNKVMFLRNHGVVACGESVEEAFHYAFNVMAACDTQMQAVTVGLENLVLVDEETQQKTFKVGSQGGGGADISGRKWKSGELEWEALMRTLDNAGYRTGHVYKQPLMKQEKKERSTSDVEVPPASSSFTYVFDGDYEHSKYVSPIKMALERQKQAYKAGWLTSPNTYKKQEIEEIGTTTPKKITKWVAEAEPSQQKSTAVKIENPNQFAPQGANPKEFKEKQKSIRKDYYEEKVTAGPQSKILEGISWDEAARMKEGGDQTIVVGAASKGIIQRDHQHNAVVYRSYYAANPFENMSEEEVKAYKRDVERRERGEEPDDEPGPEGRLISTEERMQQIQHSREDVDKQDTEDEADETNVGSVANGEPEAKSGSSQEQPASPEEPGESTSTLARDGLSVPADPQSPALNPRHQDEGLHQLADSVVQAVMASALPASLSKGQHPLVVDGRVMGTPQPQVYDSHLILLADPESETVIPLRIETPSPKQATPQSPQFAVNAEVKSPTHEKPMKAEVKTNTMTVDVPIERVGVDESPESMKVELQPLKLFQGSPGNGTMKISFTIHSTVTRRKVKGPKSSWPIENVTITQSQPRVAFVSPVENKALAGKVQYRVLQEQQNVNSSGSEPVVEREMADTKIPHSLSSHPPAAQKPAGRRYTHGSPHGRKVGSGRSGKHRKKRPYLRRGLHNPLSPVTEEFPEGEETLEALLAQQNVSVDSDESLDDLLLLTDNYKENVAPSSRPEIKSKSLEQTAPIAQLDDFEEIAESHHPVDQSADQLICSEEPVQDFNAAFLSSKAGADPAGSSVDPPMVTELVAPARESADNIKFADDDTSVVNSEASDGDVKPRKQEPSVLKPPVMEKIEQSLSSSEGEERERAEKEEEEEDSEQTDDAKESQKDGTDENREQQFELSQAEPQTFPAAEKITQEFPSVPEIPEEIVQKEEKIVNTAAYPVTKSLKASFMAPKALPEDDLEFVDDTGPGTTSAKGGSTKSLFYRRDSATLESSPIVSSPPFDSKSAEIPAHRQLHQTQSLDFDAEPHARTPQKEPVVIRRSQSVGSNLTSRGSSGSLHRNRNVAVIDAVLHTVTIDPAKIAKSGRPMSSLLPISSQQLSEEAGDKKSWTLLDTISKSLDELDVDPDSLASGNTKIYGRSLQIHVRDQLPSETDDQLQASDANHPPQETLQDEPESVGSGKKGKKLYKDEVVIIKTDSSAGSQKTKTDPASPFEVPEDIPAIPPPKKDIASTVKGSPEFSAISPRTKKDIASADEGPLQTSSPKLGRKRDGSFKKYQHKMGKSEETLLEVAPVHPVVSRSRSFPRGAGFKMQHRHTLVDDGTSLRRKEQEQAVAAWLLRDFGVTGQPPLQGGRRPKSTDGLLEEEPFSQVTRPRSERRRSSGSVQVLATSIPEERGESRRRRRSRRRAQEVEEYNEAEPARDIQTDDREPPRLRRSERRRRRQRRSQERPETDDLYYQQDEKGQDVVRESADYIDSDRRDTRQSLTELDTVRQPDVKGSASLPNLKDRGRHRGSSSENQPDLRDRGRRRGSNSDSQPDLSDRGRRHRNNTENQPDPSDRGRHLGSTSENTPDLKDRHRHHRDNAPVTKEPVSSETLINEPHAQSKRRERGRRERRKHRSQETVLDEPPVSKETLIDEPPVVKETLIDQPLAVKETLIDEPPETRETLIDEPPETRETLIDEVAVEKETLTDEPSAEAKETLIDEPPETKETLIDEPQRAQETLIDEPPEVKETLIDEPSDVEETLIDETPLTKETLIDEPPQVKETLIDEPPGAKETLFDEAPEARETPDDDLPAAPDAELSSLPPDDLDDIDLPPPPEELLGGLSADTQEVSPDKQFVAPTYDEDIGPPTQEDSKHGRTRRAGRSKERRERHTDRRSRERHQDASVNEHEFDGEEARRVEDEAHQALSTEQLELIVQQKVPPVDEQDVEEDMQSSKWQGREDDHDEGTTKEPVKEPEKMRKEAPFMSSFSQPVRAITADFPSLSSKAKKSKEELRDRDDESVSSLSKKLVEQSASVSSNLHLQDYGDEPPKIRRPRRRQEGESVESAESESRSRRRERRARNRTLDSQPELIPIQSREERDGRREPEDTERKLKTDEYKQEPAPILDIVNYDEDAPPRVRRSRQRLDEMGQDDDRKEESPRTDWRMRGRRDGWRGSDHDDNVSYTGQRAREDMDVDHTRAPPPLIRVLGSRDQLIDEHDSSAPPLPPKKHRSMEMLTDLQSQLSRSFDSLNKEKDFDASAPPELPPKKKKHKGVLACVSAADTDTPRAKESKKSKEKSLSRDRNKMPPPPLPPAVDIGFEEEPRRRHGRHSRESGHLLQVPGDDSFHRDTTFGDDSYDRASSYYGDTEDEDDHGRGHSHGRRDRQSSHHGDTTHEHNQTLSPPQTPKSIRRDPSRSSHDDPNSRTRSVSFSDGYTPTMTNPPKRVRSRDSLASESSYHSTGRRPRSLSALSATSETSLGSNRSNPLTYEPWRAKAAAARRAELSSHGSHSRHSRSQGEATYSAHSGRRRRSRTPDANRMYQPRKSRSRSSLPEAPSRSAASSHGSYSRDPLLLADDSFSDAHSHGYASESQPSATVRRSESERQPEKNRELIRELESKRGIGRSKSDRRDRGEDMGDGDKPGSPSKSDPMDSASGGETLEERSSKEGSPTKEAPSPTKEKKKKKKFRMPSFSKKKKDSKESTI